jgi:hypothetical protein
MGSMSDGRAICSAIDESRRVVAAGSTPSVRRTILVSIDGDLRDRTEVSGVDVTTSAGRHETAVAE